MNKKIQYKYLIISSSLAVASLAIYSNIINTDTQHENINFDSYNDAEITRTIAKTDKINILPKNTISLGFYDYNNGIATGATLNNVITIQEEQNKEKLFTLDEVNAIKENLLNEYNNNLYSNLNEYENYINDLTNDYLKLEKDYFDTLNNISDILNSEILEKEDSIPQNTEDVSATIQYTQNEPSEIKNKLENIKNPVMENTKTREEEIDILYRSALSFASENLNKFENIQLENVNNNSMD